MILKQHLKELKTVIDNNPDISLQELKGFYDSLCQDYLALMNMHELLEETIVSAIRPRDANFVFNVAAEDFFSGVVVEKTGPSEEVDIMINRINLLGEKFKEEMIQKNPELAEKIKENEQGSADFLKALSEAAKASPEAEEKADSPLMTPDDMGKHAEYVLAHPDLYGPKKLMQEYELLAKNYKMLDDLQHWLLYVINKEYGTETMNSHYLAAAALYKTSEEVPPIPYALPDDGKESDGYDPYACLNLEY